jgi:hypothetical protein
VKKILIISFFGCSIISLPALSQEVSVTVEDIYSQKESFLVNDFKEVPLFLQSIKDQGVLIKSIKMKEIDSVKRGGDGGDSG